MKVSWNCGPLNRSSYLLCTTSRVKTWHVHGHPFHIGNPMGIKRIVVNGWPAPNLGTQWNTIERPQRISDGPWLVHRCSSLLSPKRLAVTGWWLTYPSEKYEFSSSIRMMKFPMYGKAISQENIRQLGLLFQIYGKSYNSRSKPPTVVMGDKLLTTNQTLSPVHGPSLTDSSIYGDTRPVSSR